MAMSSITRNFVISNEKDVKKLAKALEKSYKMSLRKENKTKLSYQNATPEDINRLLKKHAQKNQ